jgi:hypothetical protein
MNCILLSKTTGLELDSYNMHSADLLEAPLEESYDTTPMMAVSSPVEHGYEEEELHTSFEQAISGRVSALQGRLSRLSAPQPVAVSYATDPLSQTAVVSLVANTDSHAVTTGPLHMASLPTLSLSASLRQRGIVLASLALGFAMLGFDLMGLLVLHMR